MKYIYDESGKRIATHHEGTEEELKLQYKDEKIYISNDYLGEVAIIEGDALRAKTEAEKVADGERILQEGEYIDGTEIKYKEKPNNFHFWDKKQNEWVYDQELEKSSLEEEIGNLEGELSNLYDELDKATARKLKTRGKQLNEQIEQLELKIENKYKRLEELEVQNENRDSEVKSLHWRNYSGARTNRSRREKDF